MAKTSKPKYVRKHKYKKKHDPNRQVVVTFPKRMHHVFPDKLKCTLRFRQVSASVSGIAYEVATYKGNALMACGPSTNNTSGSPISFASNVPSNLEYLLSSGSSTSYSTAAPYFYYRVTKSTCKAQFTPTSGNNLQVALVVMPTVNLYQPLPTTATIIDTLLEQPRVKAKLSSQTQTAGPLIVTNTAYTHDVFGISKVLVEESAYWGNVASQPGEPWYWNVTVCDALAANNIQGYLSVWIDYECEFFVLNNTTSVVPA